MSLIDQVHFHRDREYLDFEDGKGHNMAVFGLGFEALVEEIEIEAISEELTTDSDN